MSSTPKIFGAGRMYGVNNVSCPTPVAMDALQDMSFGIKRDIKSLYGRNQFAEDVAAGTAQVNWKATLGSLTGRIIADQIGGVATNASLRYNTADKEIRNLSGINTVYTTPGTVYTRVANHGDGVYLQDLGVIDAVTGQPLVRVAPSPDVGNPFATITKPTHYIMSSSGRYDFFGGTTVGDGTGMGGRNVLISYKWSGNPSGIGNLLTITNKPQGKIGNFTLVMSFEASDGEENVVTLNSNITSDFEMSSKVGDHGKPTLSGMSQVDQYGNLGSISFAQHW